MGILGNDLSAKLLIWAAVRGDVKEEELDMRYDEFEFEGVLSLLSSLIEAGLGSFLLKRPIASIAVLPWGFIGLRGSFCLSIGRRPRLLQSNVPPFTPCLLFQSRSYSRD